MDDHRNRKRKAAAAAAVLRYLQEENAFLKGSQGAGSVSRWAMNGRISLMEAPHLMQYGIHGASGVRWNLRKAGEPLPRIRGPGTRGPLAK
jgi:hypothetical protein